MLEIFSPSHSLSVDADHLSVHLGKKATNETNAAKEQIFSVEKLIIHPHFDSSSNNNDIGVYARAACVSGKIKLWDDSCTASISVFVIQLQRC